MQKNCYHGIKIMKICLNSFHTTLILHNNNLCINKQTLFTSNVTFRRQITPRRMKLHVFSHYMRPRNPLPRSCNINSRLPPLKSLTSACLVHFPNTNTKNCHNSLVKEEVESIGTISSGLLHEGQPVKLSGTFDTNSALLLLCCNTIVHYCVFEPLEETAGRIVNLTPPFILHFLRNRLEKSKKKHFQFKSGIGT